MKPKLTIGFNGIKTWCLNEKLHREDGPAIEHPDGIKHWYINGERHREDGPAIEYSNGSKYWYLNNKKLTKQQLFSKKMKINYPELYNSYLVYCIMRS